MTEIVMPDIPRIYTGAAEWMACMLFILNLEKRFSWWKTVLIAAAAFFVQIEFMTLTADIAIYFWVPCMVTAVLLMVALIALCCRIEKMDAVYYGMIAFVAAEFIASLEWQVVCFASRQQVVSKLQGGLFVFVFYNGTAFFLYQILKIYIPGNGSMNFTWRECASAVVDTALIFAVSNISYISVDTPFSSDYNFQIGNIRTMVDAAGLAILYGQLIQCCDIRVRRELEAVRNVLQNQYVQYKQSRESIDLINYKYHDLKHQIAYLRSEENSQKRKEFLDRMEEEIRQYDTQNKTGNKVLDTILTAKSLYCAKHGIGITCVADGTLLEDMDVMDICSIFGNALDNAIECELKIPEKEKRLIHVTVTRQKNFRIMRFENYYEDAPQYDRGQLVTTKREKEFHGYGLKSIQYTVDKYDGAMSITAEDGWFELKILIPVAQD